MRFVPHLRTVLFSVNVLVLLLPVTVVMLLRLYDSELIRRTEAELIAQGAIVRSAYLQALLSQPDLDPKRLGLLADPNNLPDPDKELHPIPVDLDLSEGPWAAAAQQSELAQHPVDPHAKQAGATINPLLQDAHHTTLAGIRVLDHQGLLVASSSDPKELGNSYLHFEEVRGALEGAVTKRLRARSVKRYPLDSISRGNIARVWIALPVLHNDRVVGVILLNRTPVSLTKALYTQRHLLITVSVVVLFVVFLFSLLTAFTINRPIRELIQQTERVARGEHDAVIDIRHPGTREVTQLAQGIAHMAHTLEQRADYIKNFAAHVSHEFKTPLASIRGATELLQDHIEDMSTEERERFLSNLTKDAERLDRLVRRLLELARADTLRVGSERTNPTPILKQLAERARQQGHPVTLHLPDALPELNMAPVTFESISSILVENAHVHGGDDAPIQMALQHHNKTTTLVVEDHGKGLSAENAARVFEPFFTTARHSGGSGLGLSILQSLVNAHGGHVSCDALTPGCRISVTLPHKGSQALTIS